MNFFCESFYTSLLVILLSTCCHAFIDTSGWVGVEYTPSSASNELWWYNYDQYADQLDKELNQAGGLYGFNALRMFLHPMVYEANSAQLINNMDKFLSTATGHGMRVGFVFFDDCWNHAGANLTNPCQPVKGRHNGCWMASPQDADRDSIARYQPYITDIVTAFKNDNRVLFWEIFNEPNNVGIYSFSLRTAGYGWATSVQPIQPVISCWDDNEATMIVDHHEYDTNFPKWMSAIYSNPAKGAVITEAGSRWYQGYSTDSGSPLMIVQFMSALKELYKQGKVPFVPGVFISWELMVGNSNTRWHWNTPDNTPEPLIPWDAHMFPDLTPISYTELAAIYRYATGYDQFFYFNNFLPSDPQVVINMTTDAFLTIDSNNIWTLEPTVPLDIIGDGIVELTIWPQASKGQFGLWVRVDRTGANGYFVGIDVGANSLWLEKRSTAGSSLLGSFDASKLDCGGISSTGWNMLRVVLEGPKIDVYLNPMWIDTQGPNGTIQSISPRLSVIDTQNTIAPGSVRLITNDASWRVDYVSVLPLYYF